MIERVFILGNHIQSLGIARQVGQHGNKVILFTDDRLSITRFSNAVKRSIIFNNQDDLLRKITDLTSMRKDTLLFPTNDNMVYFLSKYYYNLNEKFYLGIPVPETVDIFYNKRNTYKFAAEHNIPIPDSWYPDSMDEMEELSLDVNYPVILKPAIMHSFHKIFGKKAFKCMNRTELIETTRYISSKFNITDLVVQEYIDGGPKNLFSYGTFAANGKPIVSLIANRIRQNPMDFGNSTTFAKTCYIPEIENYTEAILKQTNYFGLAEVEFMYDEKSDQYKFLEINTRAWKWHSISNALGFGFVVKMIEYINGNNTLDTKYFDDEVAWTERLTDFAVIFKEIVRGNSILKDSYKSYMVPKTYAVWSYRDVLPFFMYILLSPVLYFKRH